MRAVGIASGLLLAAVGLFVSQQGAVPEAVEPTSQLRQLSSVTTTTTTTKNDSYYESKYINAVDPTKMKTYLHAYASVPHVCGTKQDYTTAVYTANLLKSFGIDAEIKEYYTLLSTPVKRRVAITSPASAVRELNLTEGSIKSDTCTTNADIIPPFIAYSDSGNVTASVVYLNYGRPADFEYLIENNVTLKGKIGIVRYGSNFRGLKIMQAETYGMIGVLIYSDPKDDGYTVGKVYPDGPWRPADSFQRGSAQYLSIASGDPLTPGWASTKNATRLTFEEATTVPHIPTLPLSYGQAIYILQGMGGTAVPTAWAGTLNLTNGYRIGDDEKLTVNIDLTMDNEVGTIWDVIGTIKGSTNPDELVLIGNHRDAWVCGAADPSSGTATLMEIARGYGQLLKQGWKPARTIKIASWDGEEYGLLGSTEYVEDNAATLKANAVAYINVDAFLGPNISVNAAPSISNFLIETSKSVPPNRWNNTDPGNATSLYDQWVQQRNYRLILTGGSTAGYLAPDYLVSFIGSGSDYTAFYQHVGVISANLLFTYPAVYGTYHSSMDSVRYVETVGDPDYRDHTTLAQWWGLVGMRLANDVIVPIDYSTYSTVMAKDLATYKTTTTTSGLALDYTAIETAVTLFGTNAATFTANVTAATLANATITAAAAKVINTKLVALERMLILEDGLPHRPWYKHAIFGPDYYAGYAGAAFPGISDAVAFGDNATYFQEHLTTVAAAITEAAVYMLA